MRTYKFQKLNIEEGKEYRGRITQWQIDKYDDDSEKLRVIVKMNNTDNTYLYVVKIQMNAPSRFFNFCEQMQMINEDYTVDFEVLNADLDVLFTLNKMSDGIFLVNEMWWDEEEE